MKTSAFEQWCDRLQLPTATRDFLAHLRASPPARRVQGRLFNVCGTFASRKMGVSIQFESHTVELWVIYTMEYDAQVLEFFDQPHQLELHFQGPSGRPTQALHTPDFLVLRTDGASFKEWKPEEKLLELKVTHPGRYQRDDRGTWRCPPGEAAAASLGWGPCACPPRQNGSPLLSKRTGGPTERTGTRPPHPLHPTPCPYRTWLPFFFSPQGCRAFSGNPSALCPGRFDPLAFR
jgi:TnsA endonuclease N terminal